MRRLLCGLVVVSVALASAGCSNKSHPQGGQGGAGGAQAGTGGGAGAAVNSVYERNNHASRDGHFLQPTLTKAAAAKMALDTGFAASFTGKTWASPLFLENGPAGKGIFVIVTSGNDVFALDETTGATVWTRNIGPAPGKSGAGCGDISPIGIISTPVIDPQTRAIYVAGAVGTANAITGHEIHALSPDDGTELPGWPIDVTGMTSGGVTFAPLAQNQRSALSLVGGILYVAYGGHNGDCGNYRGWVVAVNVADPTKRGAWATGGTRGEGIWAAGGMASDGNGVIVVTGNNLTRTATHADSEEVVRLTGLATVDRTTSANIFYPTSWMNMDTVDADFGASSPVYLAQPSPMVAAVSKDGILYLVDAHNFGGMNSQLAMLTLATGGAMVIHTTPAAYATAQGMHVVLTTNTGAQCAGAGANGKAVISVLIPPGSPPAPTAVWCIPVDNASLGFPASPMATTTDGTSDAVVWFMNGTKLMGVDGDTGATIYGGAPTPAPTLVPACTNGRPRSRSRGASSSRATTTSVPGRLTSAGLCNALGPRTSGGELTESITEQAFDERMHRRRLLGDEGAADLRRQARERRAAGRDLIQGLLRGRVLGGVALLRGDHQRLEGDEAARAVGLGVDQRRRPARRRCAAATRPAPGRGWRRCARRTTDRARRAPDRARDVGLALGQAAEGARRRRAQRLAALRQRLAQQPCARLAGARQARRRR